MITTRLALSLLTHLSLAPALQMSNISNMGTTWQELTTVMVTMLEALPEALLGANATLLALLHVGWRHQTRVRLRRGRRGL